MEPVAAEVHQDRLGAGEDASARPHPSDRVIRNHRTRDKAGSNPMRGEKVESSRPRSETENPDHLPADYLTLADFRRRNRRMLKSHHEPRNFDVGTVRPHDDFLPLVWKEPLPIQVPRSFRFMPRIAIAAAVRPMPDLDFAALGPHFVAAAGTACHRPGAGCGH
jgi:hypothetical protein